VEAKLLQIAAKLRTFFVLVISIRAPKSLVPFLGAPRRASPKITDEITIKQFPGLARFAARRGTVNPKFLNAEMCKRLFLGPCEAHHSKI
jgi:hypothetical protein